MFSVYKNGVSRLILAKGIAAQYLIYTKQPLVTNRTSYFATLCTSDVSAQSLNKKIKSSKCPNGSSYTVSYLTNSCGLSPERAKSAAEKVNFETPERPDLVLELLKSHGFSNNHISNLIGKRPEVLLADPGKTLLPKLIFFHSIGFTKSEIGRLLSFNPNFLVSSLEKTIIPTYKFLRSVFPSEKKVLSVLNHIWCNFSLKNLVPNVNFLREHSVPESSILLIATNFPLVLMQPNAKFLEAVGRVMKMGFDPLKTTFVLAVRVLSVKNNKLIWGRCCETYKKWGWSEDNIVSAFKKHPYCMTLSAKKIDRAMDVFVNKMGYDAKVIAEVPYTLSYDVEKRIIPRCLVVQVLISKGLLKRVSLGSVLVSVEKTFLEKYVTRFEDELPQLMSVYRGLNNSLAS